jgi:hypothetical protein
MSTVYSRTSGNSLDAGFEEIMAAGARFGAQTNNSRALLDGRGYCVLTIAASARASEKPRRTELRGNGDENEPRLRRQMWTFRDAAPNVSHREQTKYYTRCNDVGSHRIFLDSSAPKFVAQSATGKASI